MEKLILVKPTLYLPKNITIVGSGKIILKKKIDVNKDDNVDTLRLKTQKVEYRAYSEAVVKLYNMN